jgi:WD40 repeat protein
MFASYTTRGDVQVRERKAGRLLFTIPDELPSHQAILQRTSMQIFGFTRDGSSVFVRTCGNKVQRWDIATATKAWETQVRGFESPVLSADGKGLIAWESLARAFTTLDVVTGKKLKQITMPKQEILFDYAIRADGQPIVATANHDRIRVWNLATATRLGELRMDAGAHLERGASAMSARGPVLALLAADSQSLSIWHIDTGKRVRIRLGPRGDLSFHFSPDGRTLVCHGIQPDETNPATLLDAATGTVLATFNQESHENHENELSGRAREWYGSESFGFSPDGRLLASRGDVSVRLSDTRGNKQMRRWTVAMADSPAVEFSGDGRVLASREGKAVHFWDLTDGSESPPHFGHSDDVRELVFSRDGKLLATGGMDRFIGVWETATGKCLRRLRDSPSLHGCLAMSPDVKLLACYGGTSGDSVHVWDLMSGEARCHSSMSVNSRGRGLVGYPYSRLTPHSCAAAICWR